MNYKSESRKQKAESRKRQAPVLLPNAYCLLPSGVRGFSLIELVITITVLAILTLGTIPLVQVAVKRQKEAELREALRTMREAIDQFHREALAGAQAQANQQQQQVDPNSGQVRPNTAGQNPNVFADPRVRVYITDQTIFTARISTRSSKASVYCRLPAALWAAEEMRMSLRLKPRQRRQRFRKPRSTCAGFRSIR